LIGLAALPAEAAQTIFSRGTPAGATGFWLIGAGFNPAYASWNQPVGTAFNHVTVQVGISSGDGALATGTAFITNAVGPGATAANVIAGPVTVGTSSMSATMVTIPFGSVTLQQGATYFVVIQQGSGNLQWNFVNPPPGDTVSATPPVTSNVDGLGAAPATPAYNATFSAPGSPNKGVIVNITGDPPADMSITKSGPATIIAGNNISYTVSVTNNGPGSATNVTVADTAPAGLTFVSNTGACVAAYPCNLGTLASGGSASITSTYTVSAGSTGSITNTATVTSDMLDLNLANNTSSSTATVNASTDIAISKSGPATVTAGTNIVYTTTVTNNGPSVATGVSVADPTPPNLTFVSNTGGCTTAFPCSIGTMNPSATVTITSTYTVNAGATGSVSNTATVSSTTTDPTPGNNSSTSTATVSASADVSIVKSGPATATAGSNIVYTTTVTNNGPSTAAGVSVADPTPSNLTFVSNTGGCATAFPCSLGSINPSATVTITSTYTVNASATGSISNTATVSSTTTDPTPGNNSSTSTATIGASADVSIVKSGPATATAGSNIVYTITVTNNGPSAASAVSVADSTPSNLTFVSNTGGCATAFPCSIGTMNPSATVTITSTYTVNAGATGSVSNTATVSSTTTDPTPGNNSSTSTATIGASADVSIVKTGPATATAGSNITYTITVTNNGPSIATGVAVADPTPSNLTFVSNTGGCATAFPCNIGSMNPSATVTITSTYAVSPSASGSVSNTATVSSTTTDPTPGNNSSTSTATIGASADIGIVKAGPSTATPGSDVTYTLTVTNNGPSTATGVTVTDALPSGVTFVSATPSAGSCSGTTTVTCTIGSLNNGGTATVSLVVHTASNLAISTSISNTATVTSGVTDPTPGNNSSTATLTIGTPPSIPTLSPFGMGVLGLLLAAGGAMLQRRQRGYRV
jgi:uncharacterized repeat protein (TIGR01451 family)